MTADGWLQTATKLLQDVGIATARLDALVLLEDCLGRDRALLLAHPETKLDAEHIRVLDRQIKRRARHEPLAYIRGKTEFYGREFNINKNVLEPRPESETMIDLLKELASERLADTAGGSSAGPIIDIGTGSGALAITAALELPTATVLATDIDPKCLMIARKNAAKHNVDIRFLKGDLLAPLALARLREATAPFALLCNLPYVPDNFQINLAAMAEPRIAIFGGPDGLDVYRRLFGQIEEFEQTGRGTLKERWFARPRYVLTESLPPQHEALAAIAKEGGYRLVKTEDFIQVFRAA